MPQEMLFYPGSTMEKNQNTWSMPEIFIRTRWNIDVKKEWQTILESRKSSARPNSQKSRLLASTHLRYEKIELTAGHRFLPGIDSSYLANDSGFSGLKGLPSGRRYGSAWAWYHFDNFLIGNFYLEGKQGTGFSIGKQDLGQINFHPGSKTGSFTGRIQHNSSVGLLDLEKHKNTTSGYAFYKLNSIFDENFFIIEADRKKNDDDFYYKNPLFKIWEKKESPGSMHTNQCTTSRTKKYNCKIIRKGKNGQAYTHGKYRDTASIKIAGIDKPASAMRFADGILHIPWPLIFGNLIIGAAKTGYREYETGVRDPQKSESFEKSSYFEMDLMKNNDNSSGKKIFEDSLATLGFEFKTSSFIASFSAKFPKRASRRIELALKTAIKGWKFGWSAALLEGKTTHPYDFFWLETANPYRSSIRFYDTGRGAMLLYVNSDHFYFQLGVQNDGHNVLSWSRLQWQAKF